MSSSPSFSGSTPIEGSANIDKNWNTSDDNHDSKNLDRTQEADQDEGVTGNEQTDEDTTTEGQKSNEKTHRFIHLYGHAHEERGEQ